MDKHSVNYDNMNKKLTEKKAYKFNDVKDRLIKVAFDVVKFKDSDNIDGLWQVQSSDDGEVIELFPPAKSSSTSIKLTIK